MKLRITGTTLFGDPQRLTVKRAREPGKVFLRIGRKPILERMVLLTHEQAVELANGIADLLEETE